MPGESPSRDVPAFESLDQLEALAKGRMSGMAFDYIRSGAEDEVALHGNRVGFAKMRLRPRVLVDVSGVTLETEILGTSVRMPILVAPTGFHRLANPEGEAATAQGAHDAGTIYTASTIATTSLEDIAQASAGPKWFQLYVFRDRDITEQMIKRAKKAGYKAIVFTVDVPVLGRRERDIRNKFHLPPEFKMGNFDVGALASKMGNESSLAAFIATQFDASLTWDAIRWVKKVSGLPVLVKGVLRADDAELAAKNGADGIIVSNHGGRQLDYSVSSIDALPEVVAAAGNKVPIILDGGIRRGTDVLKALCLGARSVMIGRPSLWGLAIGGRAGVKAVLEHLRMETLTSMKILGAANLGELRPDFVSRP
jgi:4-hydroxymandelate oxidase